MADAIEIEQATASDVGDILAMIRGLAEYERLAHEVVATEESLRESLFGRRPAAEVVFAKMDGARVGFALFFHSYSTFLGRHGLYMEDLFVKQEHRGRGAGKALLAYLARVAIERECGRLEWAVLDWNTPAIEFYKGLDAVPMHEWTVFRVAGEGLRKLSGVG